MNYFKCGGGGADTSDATANSRDILDGKTAYVNDNKVTGSMTNNGAVNEVITKKGESYTIPEGYHDGNGKVTANCGGIEVIIDSVEQTEDLNFKSFKTNIRKKDLPYNFNDGVLVMHGDTPYIIGGNSGDGDEFYYRSFDNWHSNGKGPHSYVAGSAGVFYNGAIYIIGSWNSDYRTKMYKYDLYSPSQSWSYVGTLPYNFVSGCVVVYNDKIHILGSSYTTATATNHYAWDGSSWSNMSTLPTAFYNGDAIVYNDAIHIIGGKNNSRDHWAWGGSSWSRVSQTPFNFIDGTLITDGYGIILLDNTSCYKNYGTSSWAEQSIIVPYDISGGKAAYINGAIEIFGGDGDKKANYQLDGTAYIKV